MTITNPYVLSEAEIIADELDAMAKDLHSKATALRLEYGIKLDPKRKVEFLFSAKNRAKNKTTPSKVS